MHIVFAIIYFQFSSLSAQRKSRNQRLLLNCCPEEGVRAAVNDNLACNNGLAWMKLVRTELLLYIYVAALVAQLV